MVSTWLCEKVYWEGGKGANGEGLLMGIGCVKVWQGMVWIGEVK